MLPLAVAIAAALAAALAAAPPPKKVETDTGPTPAAAICRELDPSFVIYVPPPRRDGRNPLFWLIGGREPRPTPTVILRRPPSCLQPVIKTRSQDRLRRVDLKP